MSDLRKYTSASLGIRNNNPGNLRYTGIKWKGQIGSNKGFSVFDSVENGIRAMAIDLRTKINTRKLDTLNKYIPIYAPPSENDTTAYINNVSRQTDISPNQKINFSNDIFNLVKAHIKVENGNSASYVTDEMIKNGLSAISTGFTVKNVAPVIFIFIALMAVTYFIIKS